MILLEAPSSARTFNNKSQHSVSVCGCTNSKQRTAPSGRVGAWLSGASCPAVEAERGQVPQGQPLYLKLNDWAGFHHAKPSIWQCFLPSWPPTSAHRLQICLPGTTSLFFWPGSKSDIYSTNQLRFPLNSYWQAGRAPKECSRLHVKAELAFTQGWI